MDGQLIVYVILRSAFIAVLVALLVVLGIYGVSHA